VAAASQVQAGARAMAVGEEGTRVGLIRYPGARGV
jgi:hypothetical protein